jgi:hypothetical protein
MLEEQSYGRGAVQNALFCYMRVEPMRFATHKVISKTAEQKTTLDLNVMSTITFSWRSRSLEAVKSTTDFNRSWSLKNSGSSLSMFSN